MPTSMFKALIFAILLITMPALQAAELSIAVAANFTGAAKALAKQFREQTGHQVRVSYGSTGKLYTQIANGAPFEVFMAADSARPKMAEDEGLAVAGSRFTYARGRLVLWTPKPGLFEDGVVFLKGGGFNRLAIANPKTAPYGYAAQQVLTQLGLWDALRPRLVRGDSIAQTFQFVATENADLGFVANAQIIKWRGASGSYWRVPEDLHSPIEQQAVLLLRGKDNPAAVAFMEFLKGAQARAVIEDFGYGR